MFSYPKTAYLLLRLGLAAVFLWFGVDKFLHPAFWQTAWMPERLVSMASKFGLGAPKLVSISAIFEIFVGLSLVSSILVKFFSALAILYLLAILFVNGVTDITVRDIGLIGGFFAIIFWPNLRNRY